MDAGNIGSGMSKGTGNFAKDHRNFVAQTVGEQTTMNQMARDTGGQAFVNTNGLEEAIERPSTPVPTTTRLPIRQPTTTGTATTARLK